MPSSRPSFIALLIAGLLTLCFAGPGLAVPMQWTVASGGNGHYYDIVLVPGGISWTAANADANAAGGYLATITSAAEGAFVYTNLVDNPVYWNQESGGSDLGPWLGGYQTSDNGSQATLNWVWVTGEPWVYTSWHSGEPNNFTGVLENYLSYKCWPTANCRTSNWNDLPDNISVFGTAVLSYVIEWDAPTAVPTPAINDVRVHVFPNPFSASTRVTVTTPRDETMEIGIYDAAGRRVSHFSSTASQREHSIEWDGRTDRGARVPSGVYFLRVRTQSGTAVGRLVLLR